MVIAAGRIRSKRLHIIHRMHRLFRDIGCIAVDAAALGTLPIDWLVESIGRPRGSRTRSDLRFRPHVRAKIPLPWFLPLNPLVSYRFCLLIRGRQKHLLSPGPIAASTLFRPRGRSGSIHGNA